SHAWKVNFCKFTNETRNGLEDSSEHSGLKFIAAVNGVCAGGGYELALACDKIILVDDRSSAVSLPEVPLLGVLPGTGGLTRITDKRKVRHDLADIFCTTAEGVRGQKAKDWRLVDDIAKPAEFEEAVRTTALALAETSDRPTGESGITLTPLNCETTQDGLHYKYVDVAINREKRTATIVLQGPTDSVHADPVTIRTAGAEWYPLQFARELEDAILMLRTNELSIGTWILRSKGDLSKILEMDAALEGAKDHWLVRETLGLLRRTLSRLDVSSRSLFALIDEGSCFAGTFLEVALACDRTYHLALPESPNEAPRIATSALNFGTYPMSTGQSR
ncbi:MAG: enoyl-CoA hydratase-related protein, partial [Luminiphilus sp.]